MIRKIVCIGPYRAPSNAYLRTLAFEKLGCRIRRVDVSNFISGPGLIAKVARRISRPAFNNRVWRIREEVREFSPDLIFVEKGIQLSASDVQSLKSVGAHHMKIVHLNPDDPFGEHRSGWNKFISAIPYYDVHFVPKELNRADYLNRGAQVVFLYDRSFDPNAHRPFSLSPAEKQYYGCEIGFIGRYAPYREATIVTLARAGLPLAIWGKRWSKGRDWKIVKRFWRGGDQVGNYYAKAISGMDIALHFISRENRDLQDSRSIEIPACGTFMLGERTLDHERLFTDGVDAVFFNSADECISKCRYYLDHPAERIRIAESGYRKVFEEGYDYTSRAQEMLEAVDGCNTRGRGSRGIR